MCTELPIRSILPGADDAASPAAPAPGRSRQRPSPPATPDEMLAARVVRRWRDDGLPGLHGLLALPRTSPALDPAWEEAGTLDAAVAHVAGRAARLHLRGLTLGVVRAPGHSPTLVLDVAGDPHALPGPVLLHGHLDTRPGGAGWSEGLGPTTPVRRGRRLYGRGVADDGWAPFAALAAVAALQDAERAHPRCVLVLETAGESGSRDLPGLLDVLRTRLSPPAAVVSLDGATPDCDRLWLTTSLRGVLAATLAVDVPADTGTGLAGALAPSPMRVARWLLDRVECARTGRVLVDALHVDLPGDARTQAAATAALLGDRLRHDLAPPEGGGGAPTPEALAERLLDATWRPSLAVVGADGLPPTALAGDGALPGVALALAVHLPPTCDAEHAAGALADALRHDAPAGVRVRCDVTATARGWRAAPAPPWLRAALGHASRAAFGRREATLGGTGAIAAVRLLADAFPGAPVVVTGVPRPGGGAHAPDEWLDVGAAERVAVALAHLLAGAAAR